MGKIQESMRDVRGQLSVIAVPRAPEIDSKAIAEKVLAEIATDISRKHKPETYERLRMFAHSVVSRLEIDPETLEVEIDIIVPRWAMTKGLSPIHVDSQNVMCNHAPHFQSRLGVAHIRKAYFRSKIPYGRKDRTGIFTLDRIQFGK